MNSGEYMNLVRISTEIENVKKNQSELKNKITGKNAL